MKLTKGMKRMKAELMNVFNENYNEVKLCVSPQSLTELYAINVWLERNKCDCIQVDTTEIDSE